MYLESIHLLDGTKVLTDWVKTFVAFHRVKWKKKIYKLLNERNNYTYVGEKNLSQLKTIVGVDSLQFEY